MQIWLWLQHGGWKWPAIVSGCAILIIAAVACATKVALHREAARGPRGADGVMECAAARELDPSAEWFASHPECQGHASEAVLLIHGFVGGPNEYADLGERLAAQGYHVRLMRLPGHGTNPQDAAKQTPESLLNAVRGAYAELRREYPRVTVGGFSMGGALATILASEADVDRLMLFSPYYGITYRWFYLLPLERWNALLGAALPRYVIKGKMFVQVNRRDEVDDIYTYHVVPTACIDTLIALGNQARDPQTLKRIRCPVLLIAAEGDVASSPDKIKYVLAQLMMQNKRAVWFDKKINHQIFWDWEAERAKQTVVDWLGIPCVTISAAQLKR